MEFNISLAILVPTLQSAKASLGPHYDLTTTNNTKNNVKRYLVYSRQCKYKQNHLDNNRRAAE